MHRIALAIFTVVFLWAAIPAVRFQFVNMDRDGWAFVPRIPQMCGLDWCPGRPLER